MHYFDEILAPEDRGKLALCTTVPEFLAYIAPYGSTAALANMDETTSYEAMLHNIGQIRGKLQAEGFSQGENIAVFSPNTIFATEAFLAICSYGCRVLMLPPSLPVQALAGCVKKYELKGIFCPQALAETAQQAAGDAKVMGTDFATYPWVESTEVFPDDPAAIFLTGGTTGTPKGAVLSHRALLRGAYNGALVPDGMFGRTTYAILPFNHVFGMIRSVLSFLYTGGTVYICADMKAIFSELPRCRPDTLILVPGLADLLLQVAKLKGEAVLGGRLKLIISGAAAVPQKTIDAFLAYGVSMCPGYGLTETANLVCGNVHPLEKPGSVGKTYPDQKIKIADGEILVRGDNLMLGYYNDPQATQAAISGGWLHTGDLGRVDEDGFIYITGRIKNLIILSNGLNVAPEEVENLLYASAAVKDCLVKEMDGLVGVEIQLQPSMFPGADENALMEAARGIVQQANAQLEEYQQIRKIVIRTEDFEKTGSMKVKR